jgi:hypothetical protein
VKEDVSLLGISNTGIVRSGTLSCWIRGTATSEEQNLRKISYLKFRPLVLKRRVWIVPAEHDILLNRNRERLSLAICLPRVNIILQWYNVSQIRQIKYYDTHLTSS